MTSLSSRSRSSKVRWSARISSTSRRRSGVAGRWSSGQGNQARPDRGRPTGRETIAGVSEVRALLARPAPDLAPELLGWTLTHTSSEGPVSVELTEVEAYAGEADPASHAARGRTPRNDVMFGPPGALVCLLQLRHASGAPTWWSESTGPPLRGVAAGRPVCSRGVELPGRGGDHESGPRPCPGPGLSHAGPGDRSRPLMGPTSRRDGWSAEPGSSSARGVDRPTRRRQCGGRRAAGGSG